MRGNPPASANAAVSINRLTSSIAICERSPCSSPLISLYHLCLLSAKSRPDKGEKRSACLSSGSASNRVVLIDLPDALVKFKNGPCIKPVNSTVALCGSSSKNTLNDDAFECKPSHSP